MVEQSFFTAVNDTASLFTVVVGGRVITPDVTKADSGVVIYCPIGSTAVDMVCGECSVCVCVCVCVCVGGGVSICCHCVCVCVYVRVCWGGGGIVVNMLLLSSRRGWGGGGGCVVSTARVDVILTNVVPLSSAMSSGQHGGGRGVRAVSTGTVPEPDGILRLSALPSRPQLGRHGRH